MMSATPDNLVLKLLREIRETQDSHTKLHQEHKQAFTKLDKQMHETHQALNYALGLGTMADIKNRDQDSKIDELFEKLETLMTHK
jgi:hypothetical protein